MPSTDAAHPLRPTPLEVASGIVLGRAADAGAEDDAGAAPSPREALEAAILPGLRRPPCLVSFSGGQDSSVVLAVAAHVAAREGLAPPVPITFRVPSAPAAEEDWWQNTVVHHLGLVDAWIQLEYGEGELDWLGPVARPVMRRHGVLWPPNAFLHAPLLERARGGSLLTGVGGDNILTSWRAQRAQEVLARRVRPTPLDPARVALAYGPAPLRAAVRRRRGTGARWLRRPVRRRVIASRAAEDAAEPVRWDERVEWAAGRRRLIGAHWSLGLLAADAGAQILHPLCAPPFVAALGRAGGRTGLGDRRTILRAMAGDVLPDALLARPGKAVFHEVLWSVHSRAFASAWTGAGADRSLVEPVRLAAEWARDVPDSHTAMQLQAAWLSAVGDEPDEPLDDRVDG